MKQLKHTKYANYQLILFAVFTIITAFLVNSYLNDSGSLAFAYTSMVFYGLMLLSLFMEAIIYKKHRPIGRITIGIILLLVALLMFTQTETPAPEVELLDSPLELGGFVLILSIIVLFLMSCFTNFLLIRAYRREGEAVDTSGLTQVLAPTLKGYLPVGFFLKKHVVIFYLSIVAAMLLSAALFFVLQFLVFDNLLVNALILFVLLFVGFIAIILIHARISNAPFRAFERDLDFPRVSLLIDEYRANPKLHPETSNYLLIVKANYMLNYDSELAEALWSAVTVPTNPAYRLMYDLVMIERLTWKLDLSGAQSYILETLNNTKQANAKLQLNRRLKMNQALTRGVPESEVALIWPLKSEIKLLVIQNLSFRVLYYYLRNDIASAVTYFNAIKEMSPESKGIIQTITKLLEQPSTSALKEVAPSE